ncbi:MAG: hypothetical protein QM767_28220 [Anaeromyxobacter sp.]
MSLQVEYELPTFGMLLAPIVKLANLHETETLLQNLKKKVEKLEV